MQNEEKLNNTHETHKNTIPSTKHLTVDETIKAMRIIPITNI